ncbi:hypothetical protein GGR03_002896 [Aurantimonas endophytica]|uniref:Uncharacterized protein n=1 Tax=Aurantimonas endophytica TaxID=1522175 RepID=A0A7W6MQB0_9HYPH|nr:hypothetical protein [Aurantimonas endophytica]MBB4003815.1 hypothetical protein [Aurantimonas endophytica]
MTGKPSGNGDAAVGAPRARLRHRRGARVRLSVAEGLLLTASLGACLALTAGHLG